MEILVIIAIEIIGAATFLPSEGLIILGAAADEIVYQFSVVIEPLDDICSIVCLWSINWYHPRIFCRFKQLPVIHYHLKLIYIVFIVSFIIKLDYDGMMG